MYTRPTFTQPRPEEALSSFVDQLRERGERIIEVDAEQSYVVVGGTQLLTEPPFSSLQGLCAMYNVGLEVAVWNGRNLAFSFHSK